ncbi:lytic transglycosylase domain-containing protein [soil metagenome]
MLSALLIQDVPVECINKAAITYLVPAKVIISVLKAEGGRVGLASPNKNGSFDYGPMQINSIWLTEVARFGYSKTKLQHDPCANVMVGTWILSREIAEGKAYWQGIGNYHSHTPKFNIRYQKAVSRHYAKLIQELNNAT